MVKRIIAALLVLSTALVQLVWADEAAFQASDFFCMDTDAAGLWLRQTYAETDGVYLENDRRTPEKSYLSTEAVSRLPHGADQEFYAVKTFVVPYRASASISLQDISVPDAAKDAFRVRILKNDVTVLDWTDPASLDGRTWSEEVETGDKLHVVVKRVGVAPAADAELKLNPRVVLVTESTYMKNARARIADDRHIAEVRLTLANYVSEHTEGVLIAAMYRDDTFLGVALADEAKAEPYQKQEIAISLPYNGCDSVKLMYFSDFERMLPLDCPIMLNTKIGEGS